MNPLAVENILVPLIVFCRVGGCFMILPGISGGRIPMQFRLFISLAIALAITPFVYGELNADLQSAPGQVITLVITESLAGLFLGFLVRIFFLALEFSAIAMANFAGYGSAFSHSIDNDDPATPFSAFVTMPAIALFFILDQHISIIRMLQGSYSAFPVGSGFATPPNLNVIVETLGMAFKLTLQLSAALLVYSLTINIAFGLLNKMIPQIPSYFVSTPFVVLGGLLILLQADRSMLEIFSSLVSQAIVNLGRSG